MTNSPRRKALAFLAAVVIGVIVLASIANFFAATYVGGPPIP